MFIKYEELLQTSEYWMEVFQNELYNAVKSYMEEEGLNQTQLADKLGVSKGYISQVLKGRFNHSLKKLIELSLSIGKVPSLQFKSLNQVIKEKQLLNQTKAKIVVVYSYTNQYIASKEDYNHFGFSKPSFVHRFSREKVRTSEKTQKLKISETFSSAYFKPEFQN
jgi:transcriptional regulator with XRE-family HTH domain